MEKLSDYRLMELIKGGNNHGFTTLVNRYWEDMYKHVYARLRHEEDTKDILQEIFITVWKNRQTITIDRNGNMGGYLFQAARYCIIDHFGRSHTIIYNEGLLNEHLQSEFSAQEFLETKELEEQVQEVLNAMPERLQLPYRALYEYE